MNYISFTNIFLFSFEPSNLCQVSLLFLHDIISQSKLVFLLLSFLTINTLLTLFPHTLDISIISAAIVLIIFHKHINNKLITAFSLSLRECITMWKWFLQMLLIYLLHSNPLDQFLLFIRLNYWIFLFISILLSLFLYTFINIFVILLIFIALYRYISINGTVSHAIGVSFIKMYVKWLVFAECTVLLIIWFRFV